MCSSPVGGPLKDPEERHLYVTKADENEQVGKDSSGKDTSSSEETNAGIAASLLQLFRNVVDFFVDSAKKTKAKSTRQHLLLLKIHLEILQKEDRSQDVKFLNQLSNLWLGLLEDSLTLKNETARQKLTHFLKSLQHYPENTTHTFGYYLSEYAGQKWVPFPYMELIQKIHTEHQNSPTSSNLLDWSRSIDTIIPLLQRE